VKNCEDRDGKIIEKVERESIGNKKRENKENGVGRRIREDKNRDG
jgi:hypothetical protein